MEKYIVANEAFYDEDKQLWGCYIGQNNKEKTLLLTVWETNQERALMAAKWMKGVLEGAG